MPFWLSYKEGAAVSLSLKIGTAVLAVVILSGAVSARAGSTTHVYLPRRHQVVGRVTGLKPGSNTLYVLAKNPPVTYRFVVHNRTLAQLKEGACVRVYWEGNNNLAVSVKTLTPVNYDPNGRNGGFVSHSPAAAGQTLSPCD